MNKEQLERDIKDLLKAMGYESEDAYLAFVEYMKSIEECLPIYEILTTDE